MNLEQFKELEKTNSNYYLLVQHNEKSNSWVILLKFDEDELFSTHLRVARKSIRIFKSLDAVYSIIKTSFPNYTKLFIEIGDVTYEIIKIPPEFKS